MSYVPTKMLNFSKNEIDIKQEIPLYKTKRDFKGGISKNVKKAL